MTMKIFKGLTHGGTWYFWNEYGYRCVNANGGFWVDYLTRVVPKEIDEETIGQYTGFIDKKGNYVFVGDIVRNTFEDGNKELLQVIFNKNNCAFELVDITTGEHISLTQTDAYISEVIGNIYDKKFKHAFFYLTERQKALELLKDLLK